MSGTGEMGLRSEVGMAPCDPTGPRRSSDSSCWLTAASTTSSGLLTPLLGTALLDVGPGFSLDGGTNEGVEPGCCADWLLGG